METRKILLLSSMVLAVAAFAVPSSAMATDTLLDNGKTVNDKVIELTGPVGLSSLGGGMECTVHQTLTINGVTLRLTSMIITTSTCVGLGGLAGCRVTSDTVTGMPWVVDVKTSPSRLVATTWQVDYSISAIPGKVCQPKSLVLSVGEVTMTPDNANAIKSVGISGEGSTLIEGIEIESEISGSLSVVGADAGTYQIGTTTE